MMLPGLYGRLFGQVKIPWVDKSLFGHIARCIALAYSDTHRHRVWPSLCWPQDEGLDLVIDAGFIMGASRCSTFRV